MTHNVYEKGQPEGLWATASRSPAGEYGVAVGCGQFQIAFIPEAALAGFLAAALKIQDSTDEDIQIPALVADAAGTLPQLKAVISQRERLAAGATSN